MQEIGLDLTYFIIAGFFVEILTELVKKLWNLKGGWILLFAIGFGILFSVLTLHQSIKYQLAWDIPDLSSVIITGVISSSFAKFYDYVYKITKLKSKI